MIKLIIFDLDGVLVDARELHYEALNRALGSIDPKYVIGRDEHLSTYDGLSTTKKLNMLTASKGLPKNSHSDIWQSKQTETINIINNEMTFDYRMRRILAQLASQKYKLCVASNSIRVTVEAMLIKRGLMEYFEFFYSNQDVSYPKPSTEMYLRCMLQAEVAPKETLIIEDSHIGRQAVNQSGAYLHGVTDAEDVSYEKIEQTIRLANNNLKIKPK